MAKLTARFERPQEETSGAGAAPANTEEAPGMNLNAKLGLARHREEMRRRREAGETIVLERKDPVQKAKENPNSLRLAINAHCFQCMGSGADPIVRASIRYCPVHSCSLHPVSQYQNAKGKSADELSEEEFENLSGADQDFEDSM